MLRSLVGSEMCIRDSVQGASMPAVSYLLGRWSPPDERSSLFSIANTGLFFSDHANFSSLSPVWEQRRARKINRKRARDGLYAPWLSSVGTGGCMVDHSSLSSLYQNKVLFTYHFSCLLRTLLCHLSWLITIRTFCTDCKVVLVLAGQALFS